MSAPDPPENELLIVSVSPQNLERGVLWFTEHEAQIKQTRHGHLWWRENSYIAQPHLSLNPSVFIRALVDLGYERAQSVHGKGLFAVRGGIIEVWPINTAHPYLIEFTSNIISSITLRQKIKERVAPPRSSKAIEKLPIGSFVVHIDHGIGIYRGLKQTNTNTPRDTTLKQTASSIKSADDFFVIEYAPPKPSRDPDKLFVPCSKKDRLSPYVGFITPTIHRLGGSLWKNTKKKVRQDTEMFARQLLALYKKRHQAQRPPISGDPALMEHLHETFPYEETQDQHRAEKEILADFARPLPSDRILCGDVGFGKTEIALRAAVWVISAGYQVAILAPTTILAAQHAEVFSKRTKQLPIRMASLSRLSSPQETKHTISDIADGGIDCIVGTHRILSRDIRFHNLGLIIVDEEQRFGVKQKDHFKRIRENVDILSLSATPIPRTLSLALARIRAISRIASPPPGRKPIQTFVLPHAYKTIARAIRHELKRNGQVYFLHNRIETIAATKQKLEQILRTKRTKKLPRIAVIHGRMSEKQIISTMGRFRNKEIDILLATTIIENGIDVASANTLIVDDAPRLGLAQAHQLRGRIGRGTHQAYAYFLYKPRSLAQKAQDRLAALQDYANLGEGYEIALRDLEIRGAGNVLGREQSGAINKVGLNVYYQMLSEAIEDIHALTNAS